jgi:hypothetical protein
MARTKIGILPQLAISLVKGQVALKDLVGECFHRHLVINVRDLSVVN